MTFEMWIILYVRKVAFGVCCTREPYLVLGLKGAMWNIVFISDLYSIPNMVTFFKIFFYIILVVIL